MDNSDGIVRLHEALMRLKTNVSSQIVLRKLGIHDRLLGLGWSTFFYFVVWCFDITNSASHQCQHVLTSSWYSWISAVCGLPYRYVRGIPWFMDFRPSWFPPIEVYSSEVGCKHGLPSSSIASCILYILKSNYYVVLPATAYHSQWSERDIAYC